MFYSWQNISIYILFAFVPTTNENCIYCNKHLYMWKRLRKSLELKLTFHLFNFFIYWIFRSSLLWKARDACRCAYRCRGVCVCLCMCVCSYKEMQLILILYGNINSYLWYFFVVAMTFWKSYWQSGTNGKSCRAECVCMTVCGRDTQKVTKNSKQESCRVRDQNGESTSVSGHNGYKFLFVWL